MMMSVCVASVRGTVLRYLIDSILAQTFDNWELIVVAQGDDPVLLSEVKRGTERDRRIRAIHMRQFGKCRAINRAMEEAHGDVFAFVDDDCEASPDWLATIDRCLTQRPDVGVVAGNLVAPPAQRFSISTCPATYTLECVYKPAESGFAAPPGFYFGGGNMAVRRSVMERVGPFDHFIGPGTAFPSSEDVDWGLRAEELDVAMWTTPTSIVYHTYGRRYGVRNMLKHYRAYALGNGALSAKLTLWDHRLLKAWGQPRTVRRVIGSIARNPARGLLDLYKSQYIGQAHQKYIAEYELGPNRLSRRRNPQIESRLGNSVAVESET